ncbi:helix-turn-helix domain-containing protein [Hyalangium versicolor]|uniref:helix-turn-helix domain-containing protein n=1 Tax=Hyalangium versicolor TaxID=2861190 RepID=UPI001CD01173|nr:helix-turn-helix domain-containing protein [Hyalangium versicolor]
MNALLYRPGPPLEESVSCFWLSEEGRASVSKERVLPSGALSLVISLREDRFFIYGPDERTRLASLPGAIVSGAHPTPFAMDVPARGLAIGVCFRPGGAVPFLGVPAHEFEGKQVGLDALWGRAAALLREQLIEASSPHEQFHMLEVFLLARRRYARPTHPGVAMALRAFGDPSLRSVAEVNGLTGLSPKRLIALFRAEVGLGPKTFWRVRRFREALRRLEPGGPIRGAELALDCGYCDQAHFNRDFRHFAGLSPREYLVQGLARPNHIRLAG